MNSLIAIRIDRRALAVAMFNGTHLVQCQTRHLSSRVGQANDSANAFVKWLVVQHSPQGVALERLEGPGEYRRLALTKMLIEALRPEGVPVFEVVKLELFDAFGCPPLSTRKTLREVVVTVWPVLAAREFNGLVQDAAALGLYVQTERLFSS